MSLLISGGVYLSTSFLCAAPPHADCQKQLMNTWFWSLYRHGCAKPGNPTAVTSLGLFHRCVESAGYGAESRPRCQFSPSRKPRCCNKLKSPGALKGLSPQTAIITAIKVNYYSLYYEFLYLQNPPKAWKQTIVVCMAASQYKVCGTSSRFQGGELLTVCLLNIRKLGKTEVRDSTECDFKLIQSCIRAKITHISTDINTFYW